MENLNQKIFTLNVARLIMFIFEKGYSCTFGETYRTPEQAELNAKKGIGIKNSLHCKRLAVDLNLFDPSEKLCTQAKDYEPFGIYWEQLHDSNRWGGNFQRVDSDHFEMNAPE
jgi:hypothetical protein